MGIEDSPIIILGMHRSGTKIFAEVLNEANIFFGKDLDGHFESKSFRKLNIKILRPIRKIKAIFSTMKYI
mgnify:CR=1 FL=1